MLISVIIPAYHEEEYLPSCIASVERAKEHCPCDVEIYIAKDIKGIGRARNIGAANTVGNTLVFLDADCLMSSNFLAEVYEKARIEENIGGGTKWVHLDRYSLSTLLSLIPVGIKLYYHQITIGAFWVKRKYFELLRGFDDATAHNLDYDFAIRLKTLAHSHDMKFRSLKNSYITWSTRGTKKYGEWFWIWKYKEFRSGK